MTRWTAGGTGGGRHGRTEAGAAPHLGKVVNWRNGGKCNWRAFASRKRNSGAPPARRERSPRRGAPPPFPAPSFPSRSASFPLRLPIGRRAGHGACALRPSEGLGQAPFWPQRCFWEVERRLPRLPFCGARAPAGARRSRRSQRPPLRSYSARPPALRSGGTSERRAAPSGVGVAPPGRR